MTSSHPSQPQPWQPEYLEALLAPAEARGEGRPRPNLRVAPGVLEILGAETLRKIARTLS